MTKEYKDIFLTYNHKHYYDYVYYDYVNLTQCDDFDKSKMFSSIIILYTICLFNVVLQNIIDFLIHEYILNN